MKQVGNRWELDEADINELGRIFLELTRQTYSLGYQEHWVQTVLRFLEIKGYEIKKTPQAGD